MTQPAMISIDPAKREDQYYRYKMPSVIVKIEGSGNGIKTVFPNIEEICAALSRPVEFIMKHFQWELGAQRTMKKSNDNTKCLLMGKFEEDRIQRSVDGFVEKFVLCSKCRSPETKLSIEKAENVYSTCDACGAKVKVNQFSYIKTYLQRILPSEANQKNKKTSGIAKEDNSSSPLNMSSLTTEDSPNSPTVEIKEKEGKSVRFNVQNDDGLRSSPTDSEKVKKGKAGEAQEGKSSEKGSAGGADFGEESPVENGLRKFRKVIRTHPDDIQYQVDVVASMVRQYLDRYCRSNQVGVMIVMGMLENLFPNALCAGVQKYQSLLLHFTWPSLMEEQLESLDEIEKAKKRKEEAQQRVKSLRAIAMIFKNASTPYSTIDRLIHLIVVMYIEGVVDASNIKTWIEKPFSEKVTAETTNPQVLELVAKMQPVLKWLKVDGSSENNS